MVTLVLVGFVGGLITGISPCVLPVLPVVFLSSGAPSGQDSAGSRDAGRRPLMVVLGLTLSFSVFTVLGSLVLRTLPVPQDIIRWAGIVILALLGAGMIVPRFEGWLERPFARLAPRAPGRDRGGFLLGLALGAVYVPCAGPVLAAIAVAGATGRIGASTLALTVAFATGTAVPLLIFALAGWRITDRIRAFRTRQRGIRIAAGVVVIALAVALTFNVTDAVQRAIPDYTSALSDRVNEAGAVAKALGGGGGGSGALADCQQSAGEATPALENCGPAPQLTGLSGWLNTPGDAPLTPAALTGKVVLIDFWAYSCINCQRAIPHVNAWSTAYAADGLQVIGVHTPEYAFEHVPANVAAGATRLGITYPIALDNDYKTWGAFHNDSWPADYLIDATGRIRYVNAGEGDYPQIETLIRRLLASAHPGVALPKATEVPDLTPTWPYQTPETYLGAARGQAYEGRTPLRAGTATFTAPAKLDDDSFGLSGTWTVSAESITAKKDSVITLDYTADDIYLDLSGTGSVTVTVQGTTHTYAVGGAPNIYTVLSGITPVAGTLRATLSPGLSAYSFTFG